MINLICKQKNWFNEYQYFTSFLEHLGIVSSFSRRSLLFGAEIFHTVYIYFFPLGFFLFRDLLVMFFLAVICMIILKLFFTMHFVPEINSLHTLQNKTNTTNLS